MTRTFEYTATGMLSRVEDETGVWTEFTYDPTWGLFPISTKNLVGTVHTSWDFGCGAVESVTDLNDQTTTTDYDAFCRVARTEEPASGFVERQYLGFGNPDLQRTRVETNPPPGVSGVAWTESYLDGFGRTYKTVTRGPTTSKDIVVDQVFNPRGGVQTATQPYYEDEASLVTGYEYDALDRVVKVNLPGSGSILTSYTASSQTTTDPNGKTTTTRFDHFGRVKTVERPFKGQTATTTTHYDRLGRRDWMTDPVEAEWTWIYDSLGRVVDDRDPDRGRWLYEYDDAGRLDEQTDAKGQVTTHGLRRCGRISTRQNAAGTDDVLVRAGAPELLQRGQAHDRDVRGPEQARQHPALRLRRARPGRSDQSPTVDGQTYTATKEWAPGGYLETFGYEEGDTVGPIGYDEAGRVKSIPGIVNTVTYDASGRPRQRTNANLTTTTWTYSPTRGVLERISTLTGGAADPEPRLHDRRRGPRPRGHEQRRRRGVGVRLRRPQPRADRPTNTASPGDSQTFDYDAGDRIRSNSRGGDVRLPPTPGQPRPHAPSSVERQRVQVRRQRQPGLGGRPRAGVERGEPDQQVDDQVGTTRFAYDGFGERLKKTNGSPTSLYPFGDDYEITNGVTTKYISVEGLGVVAKKVTGGSNPGTYWLHTDRLGWIEAITNARRQPSSSPAGPTAPTARRSPRDGSHTESRGWIDQRNDPETGLTYLHARYFDPKLGTFLSPDPIGVAGGMNQYGYGFGDPVNNADRSGLDPNGGPDIPWWWLVRGLWWIFGGGDDRPPCNPFTCRSGSAEDRHPQPGGGGTPADGGGHAVPRNPGPGTELPRSSSPLCRRLLRHRRPPVVGLAGREEVEVT